MRVFARNLFGLLLGVAAFGLVSFVVAIIFGFLTSIPLLAWLLSFPTTPELYSRLGTTFAGASAAIGVSSFVSEENNSGYVIANIILGALFIALAVFNVVGCIRGGTITFDIVVQQIMLAGFGYISIAEMGREK